MCVFEARKNVQLHMYYLVDLKHLPGSCQCFLSTDNLLLQPCPGKQSSDGGEQSHGNLEGEPECKQNQVVWIFRESLSTETKCFVILISSREHQNRQMETGGKKNSRKEEKVRSPWKVVWLKKESSLGRCVSLWEPSLRGEV